LLRLLRQAGKLDPDLVIIDAVIVRDFGGGKTIALNPVDRRKMGTKHTLLVDRHGVPVATRTAGANASDHRQIVPLVLEYPEVKGKQGPEELPDKLHGVRGCDSTPMRGLLACLGTEPHGIKWRTTHGSGLKKIRWGVVWTLSRLKGLRRLRIRYDRQAG
jgi:transposase